MLTFELLPYLMDATIQATMERAASESLRYQQYYGIDYLDASNYDIVVDTSSMAPLEVVTELIGRIDR